MGTRVKLVGIVLCALAAAACGEDGFPAGTAGSGGAQAMTVTGVVNNWGLGAETPVPGATVAVFGTEITATTDASGEFTLENVPHGDVFFTTTADGNWGFADYYYVPEETSDPIELGVLPDDDIAALGDELQRTFSEADGMLEIVFYEGAVGGETGTISAPSDAPFTIALDGQPIEQDGVIADEAGYGPLTFSSVKTGDGPLTVGVTGVSGMTTCTVDETPGTTYPVIAKTITIAYAYCEAAQ